MAPSKCQTPPVPPPLYDADNGLLSDKARRLQQCQLEMEMDGVCTQTLGRWARTSDGSRRNTIYQ